MITLELTMLKMAGVVADSLRFREILSGKPKMITQMRGISITDKTFEIEDASLCLHVQALLCFWEKSVLLE